MTFGHLRQIQRGKSSLFFPISESLVFFFCCFINNRLMKNVVGCADIWNRKDDSVKSVNVSSHRELTIVPRANDVSIKWVSIGCILLELHWQFNVSVQLYNDNALFLVDHHCPWINNCVGSNNMKHFLQFIVWTFIGCTYAATLSIYRGVMCYKNPYICQPFPPTSGLLMYAGSTILALFFAIFVAAMASDQYEGLVTDTTGIESMNVRILSIVPVFSFPNPPLCFCFLTTYYVFLTYHLFVIFSAELDWRRSLTFWRTLGCMWRVVPSLLDPALQHE